MRGLPVEAKLLLTKARESAILAVETYNRPTASFRSGAFIILMIVAWTSLFHAIFLKKKKKPFYRKRNSTRYEKIDGDNKAWELSECLKQYYKDELSSVRLNIQFFIRLRNKLEHRSLPELDTEIFGECQALLMNFEEMLVEHFGRSNALRAGLTFALQFSTNIQPAQSKAMTKLNRRNYQAVKDFVTNYRSALSEETGSDPKYSFKVFLVPKINNHVKSADAAVEFVKYDPDRPEEMRKYEHLVTFIKEKQVPVANLGYLKAGEVIKEVSRQRGNRFNHYDHKLCYQHFHARPTGKASDPAATNSRYCIYDATHRDYVYKPEWVEFLVEQMERQDLLNHLRELARAANSAKGI